MSIMNDKTKKERGMILGVFVVENSYKTPKVRGLESQSQKGMIKK